MRTHAPLIMRMRVLSSWMVRFHGFRIAADVASSEPAEPGREVRCPGMGEHRSRKENMELGIPVAEEKWAEVLAM